MLIKTLWEVAVAADGEKATTEGDKKDSDDKKTVEKKPAEEKK